MESNFCLHKYRIISISEQHSSLKWISFAWKLTSYDLKHEAEKDPLKIKINSVVFNTEGSSVSSFCTCFWMEGPGIVVIETTDARTKCSANLRPYYLQLAREICLFVMGIKLLLGSIVETSVHPGLRITPLFYGAYHLPISFWSRAFLNIIYKESSGSFLPV